MELFVSEFRASSYPSEFKTCPIVAIGRDTFGHATELETFILRNFVAFGLVLP